mgnify:CR=1 FL=1
MLAMAGHSFGPDSQEVMDMTLRSDRNVAELFKDLDAAGLPDSARAVRAGDETEASYRASGTVALSAIQPRASAAKRPALNRSSGSMMSSP